MRISHTCRRMVSAALSAMLTAALIVTPAAPVSAASITVGKKLTTKEGTNAYRGETAKLATSGLKSISVYVTVDAPDVEEVTVSYGFGIGIGKDPWWIEMDHGKFTQTPKDPDDTGTSVKIPANVSTPIKVDVSGVSNIKYDTGQYAGEFEFRNYYVSNDGTLTLDKIVPNDTASTTTPDKDKDKDKPSTKSSALKSGAYTFKDNKDGTATISSTLTATLDELDTKLTAGKDEEDYLDKNGNSTWEEGDPINSRKISYEEMGVPAAKDENTKITLESFSFAVSSKTNLDTFMYGIGLNVEYKSPADTEYWLSVGDDAETKKGYWYNEHGNDEDGNPSYDTDAVEIEIGAGTTLEDCGKWVDTTWELPADVKKYATAKGSDAVSFQFWYGANKEDGYEEVKAVTLESAACTFTIEKTVPYDFMDSLDAGFKLTQGDDDTNSKSVKFSTGDKSGNGTPHAIKFTLSCPSDIKKLVFGVGVSDKAAKSQYTQEEFAILEAGKKQEIMWILPDGVNADSDYGEVTFGYYYGADSKDNLVDTITVSDITVYYEELEIVEETTTVTTTTTTQETTTTTQAETEAETKAQVKPDADWGDADCDGAIDVADAVLIARFAAEDTEATITAQGKTNGDVTHDGNLTIDDTTKILRYIAKQIKEADLAK